MYTPYTPSLFFIQKVMSVSNTHTLIINRVYYTDTHDKYSLGSVTLFPELQNTTLHFTPY